MTGGVFQGSGAGEPDRQRLGGVDKRWPRDLRETFNCRPTGVSTWSNQGTVELSGFDVLSGTAEVVPGPRLLLLLGAGLAGMLAARRRIELMIGQAAVSNASSINGLPGRE